MAKSADESQVFLYDLDGETVEVAREHRDAFLKENPGAQGVSLYDAGGETFEVADGDLDAFRKANPNAERVHLFDSRDGSETVEVARKDVPAYIGERAKEGRPPEPPRKSVGRDLLDVTASRLGAAALSVAAAPAELLGGIASASGGVDRRAPEGQAALAAREHQERGDTWDPVMKMWHRAEPVMTADRRSWAKRQWDKAIHGGFGADRQKGRIGSGGLEPMRGVQQFNDALVEMGHTVREVVEGTKARPETLAGEVVAPLAETAGTLGKYAALGPTGLAAPVMAMEGAGESLARTEGRQDLSQAQRLGLAAAGAGAQAAIFGAAGAQATAPLGRLARIGTETPGAGTLVRAAGERGIQDAAKMAAASVAGDVAAAEPVDWRRAGKAGAEGFLIGAGAGAAGAVPRAIERGATESARRTAAEIAATDPAGTLSRVADRVAPPDLAEAGANVEAAQAPEGAWDAYARRKRAEEAPPLTDYAGDLGRQFLENGPRNTGNMGSEPPASGGASRPGEPQIPAPAPAAEPAAAPRRVTGRPRELSTMHGNGNSTTLATVKNRAEKGVLPVEIVVRPNGMGVSRAGQFDANEPVVLFRYEGDGSDSLGYPVFGNTERILAWAKESGLADKAGVSTVEPAPVAESPTPPRAKLPEEVAHDKAEAARQEAVAALAAARETGDVQAVRDATKRVQSAARKEDNARKKMEAAVAKAETPPQSANISRRYTAKPLVFQKPIVGPSGARIVSYNWTNKPVEYVDERGEDRVKRVSDWDYSNENEDTGRQIVHSFVVEMPDGTSRAVSAESAAKALGYPVGKFKTEALREIRQAMLVDSLPAEQVAGFVEALGRSTRTGARNAYPIYKQTDKVSILKDGTIRIVGNRKADGIADRWPVVITTVSPDGTIKTERLSAWPTTKGKAISADAIAKRAQAPAPSRGSVRADIAAETPRLGDAAPKRGIRSELQVLLDAGERDAATLEDLAKRAEAEDAFETAALARQAAGTYRGSPWNTEGGNWPHEEPPAARASFGDLFTLARNLGEGRAPEFVRRISRLPWAEGVFRFDEGEPGSGRIQERSGLLRLVPDARIEAIRSEAQAEAAAKGLSPEQAQTLFSRKLRSAIRESAFAGPKPAMAVLAHEIGHWVDFLDEGTLKRGNVLGHIAALKRWGQRQIYPTKAAADAAGFPGLTRAEVKAKAKEWKVSEGEARRRLVEERDMAALPDLRREMESLVAWYRQSDGAPEYFRSSPSELYAEAFSAWVNYPAETARRAPAFAAILDGWMAARPEAARALREFRDGVTQAEARAAKAAGDVTNPAFFAALDQESGAARRAEELAGRLTDEALARGDTSGWLGRKWISEGTWAKIKLGAIGPDDILKGELMRSPLGAFNAHNLPLWRAMQQKDNANNRMVLWDYRFRTHVEPLLQGVPHETFLNYLYHSRVANELLGPDATRGRMNLPNTNGLTPGDVSRAQGNAQTSSAAWLNELRRTHPEIAEKCEAARREFWAKVRNGGDELGGEGSPMDVIRNSPCLSAEQKAALLGNEWYVAFRPAVVPDVSRAVSTGEMSVWDGIFSQRTGSEKPVGDVLANTLLQDLTMQDQLLRQEYRLRAVDWLRANKAEWVGEPVQAVFDKATGRAHVEQREKQGWRVVAFLRDGRPEGWWVRDFIADALAPKPHQVSSLEGWRGLANRSARGINALKTTLNPAFGVANTLKDAFSIALRQLPRDTSGVGQARALLDGAANWLGDYGAMMRSFRDTSAADIIHAKWNPDAARALAWGALNNAAPNQSAYAGGGEKGGVGELAARYRELGRSEVSDKDLRAALKTFGYSEKQIEGALDRTESGLVRALREAARVTGARWAAEKHGQVMAFLSRGEIRTKSFALAEAMRRNPGMTREEAVQWVHDMIGTPAMNNRPTVAKLPGIGHVVPFLTPRVHGWTDQLYGALRTGWTGGPGRSAQVASRLAFATTMMAIPLAAVSILRDEAEEAERKGDKGRAAALAGMARRWQAIPSTDILTGICFPNPLGKNTHIKIPVDPTIVPIAALALEKIFGGGGKNLAPGAGMEQFTGDLMPTLGTVPTMALALTNGGVDPNTGRRVVGERTPGLDRLTWSWDQLTARGLGMLPGSMLRAWMVGNEDAREMERASRADKWTPVVSALWRPFLRRSGYGLVERANVMRDLNAAAGKKAQGIAERLESGRPVSKEDEDWFYENVTDPRAMRNSAAARLDALKTKTPDQRAAEALPAIRADAIEKAAGYIRPPSLTDEDRAR